MILLTTLPAPTEAELARASDDIDLLRTLVDADVATDAVLAVNRATLRLVMDADGTQRRMTSEEAEHADAWVERIRRASREGRCLSVVLNGRR